MLGLGRRNRAEVYGSVWQKTRLEVNKIMAELG
jgi:hypothetical protein